MYRVNTIFILNRDLEIIDTISRAGDSSFFDDTYDIDLVTGTETFEFSVNDIERYSSELVGLNYILFKFKGKFKLLQIMTEGYEHEEGNIITNIYCENTGISLINEPAPSGTITGNISNFLRIILDQTNFIVGDVDSSLNKVITVEIDNKTNVLKAIQDNISKFDCEIEFDIEIRNNKIIKQKINCYKQRGSNKNKIYTFGKGVEAISKKIDWTEFCTAIKAYGKDDITVAGASWSISNGNPINKPADLDYVPNMEAYSIYNNNGRHIWGYFESEAEDKYALLQEAYEEGLNRGKPKADYEVKVVYDDELDIGDTVKIRDFDFKPKPLLLEARVSKLKLSFSDETKCTAEFANYKEVESKIKSLKKEDIMKEVLDYIKSLEIGMLDKTTIDRLSQYLYAMGIEKSEIDRIVDELNKIANEQLEEEQRNKVQGEYIDILINDSTRKYICDVVKSLKFRLPSAIPTGFSTTLEFTTEKDTVPTKFFQDTNCWCNGVDCWNGGLVPFADTTYTIILTPNTDSNIVQKYRGNVTKVSHGGSYRSYENKTSYVEKVREVMQSYYYVRDKFIYNTITPFSFKDPTTSTNKPKWQTSGKFHIDCSTFVHFVIRGIPYEQSTYAIPTKSPYFLNSKYDYSFVLDATISDRDRYASDMARACIEQGWQLNIDMTNRANWKQLRAGDIVFWAKRYGEESFEFKERYMKVGHVAIVSTVLEDGDVTTYESTSGFNNSILNRRLSANYPEKILFVARPRR